MFTTLSIKFATCAYAEALYSILVQNLECTLYFSTWLKTLSGI